MKTLEKYRANVFSQNGEDGLIEELCRRLGVSAGTCVEFGAWDGKHLSNTYNLVRNKGWKAVYIEGDETRFRDLEQTVREQPGQITPMHAFVSDQGENRLDALLGRAGIAKDFDLLSIDIDSSDWQVWNAMVEFQPKIVVVEINSGLRPGIMQVHQGGKAVGSSFSSTLELGLRKGYRLVAHTGNMFFVRSELVDRVGLSVAELEQPEVLFDYRWIDIPPLPQRAFRKLKRLLAGA